MFNNSYTQLKPVSDPQEPQNLPKQLFIVRVKKSRLASYGVAVAAKAEGLWEGTGWGKGGYISVRADEMAGKVNNLSGRRLFRSLS